VENFLDTLRIPEEGYSNVVGSEVNVSATGDALEIAAYLNIEINNSLDLLYFYQQSQNDDGGFGPMPETNSTWINTIRAISGLKFMNNIINHTQIQNWKIHDYLNDTSSDLLYTNITRNNESVIVPFNLTLPIIEKWYQFLFASFQLGFNVKFDYNYLVTNLKDMQYSNGSYYSFDEAVWSVRLLSLLGEKPSDFDLSAKYIKAFIQNNGVFSNEINGTTSIYATYEAISTLYDLGVLQWVTDTGYLETLTELIVFILNLQNTNSGFHEVGRAVSTLKDTLRAIKILFWLESLDELLSPDVLQTEGFIGLSIISPAIALILVPIWRKRA
jgi:prenyltransferase beta subunit